MNGLVSDQWWMLSIVDRVTQEVLGDLAIHPTLNCRSVEIGYTLTSSAWGNGYAKERFVKGGSRTGGRRNSSHTGFR